MFCLFTKAVRDHYITAIRSCCKSVDPCCQRQRKTSINQRRNQGPISTGYGRRVISPNSIPQTFISRRLSPSMEVKGSGGQEEEVISWPDLGYPGSPNEGDPYSNETSPLLTNRS